MSNTKLSFDIDVAELSGLTDNISREVKDALNDGARSLAVMTHAKVLELASEQLNSSAETYKNAVDFEEVSPNIWVVSLDLKKAGFIEEPTEAGFMEWLLKGKSAKTARDGSRYAVIPFEHSKRPSQQTQKARELTNQIRGALRSRDIPYKKLELNADGSPRIGKLHTFSEKNGNAIASARPSKMAKYPALEGLTIYQSKNPKTGKVSRDVFTFRVITDKHREEGLWHRPSSPGKKIFEAAHAWAEKEFVDHILPEIMEKINKNI